MNAEKNESITAAVVIATTATKGMKQEDADGEEGILTPWDC